MLSGRLKRRVSAELTKPYLDALERLIREEVYISNAEVVRDALRRLFRHYGIWMEILDRDSDTQDCSREGSSPEGTPISKPLSHDARRGGAGHP